MRQVEIQGNVRVMLENDVGPSTQDDSTSGLVSSPGTVRLYSELSKCSKTDEFLNKFIENMLLAYTRAQFGTAELTFGLPLEVNSLSFMTILNAQAPFA